MPVMTSFPVDALVLDVLGTLVDERAGLRTAYVPRPGGDPPTADDRVDLHAASLDDLADQLGAHRC